MRKRRRIGWLLAVAGVPAALAVLHSLSEALVTRAAADRNGEAGAHGHPHLLASELQTFPLRSPVPAEYAGIARVPAGGPAATLRLDAPLKLLAARADAAVLHAIGARGWTMAWSNWRLPISVIGQDCTLRCADDTPFASTKPQALGLGPPIARHIARGFGGDPTRGTPPGRGATFLPTLRLS